MFYKQLLSDLNEAFNGKLNLPIAVFYSEQPKGEDSNTTHCMFEVLEQILQGKDVCFTNDTLRCGGGKTYCGYRPLHPNIPKFVSLKERYKQTPEMVSEYVEQMEIADAKAPYLNLVRLDHVPEDQEIEGIFFICDPDELSGLAAWAYFDNNSMDAVQSPFASGCGALVSFLVRENRRNGRSCFIGMMDISARKYLKPNQLSFSIPFSRLREMASTLRQSCLFDAPAWQLIRQRLE